MSREPRLRGLLPCGTDASQGSYLALRTLRGVSLASEGLVGRRNPDFLLHRLALTNHRPNGVHRGPLRA